MGNGQVINVLFFLFNCFLSLLLVRVHFCSEGLGPCDVDVLLGSSCLRTDVSSPRLGHSEGLSGPHVARKPPFGLYVILMVSYNHVAIGRLTAAGSNSKSVNPLSEASMDLTVGGVVKIGSRTFFLLGLEFDMSEYKSTSMSV